MIPNHHSKSVRRAIRKLNKILSQHKATSRRAKRAQWAYEIRLEGAKNALENKRKSEG